MTPESIVASPDGIGIPIDSIVVSNNIIDIAIDTIVVPGDGVPVPGGEGALGGGDGWASEQGEEEGFEVHSNGRVWV